MYLIPKHNKTNKAEQKILNNKSRIRFEDSKNMYNEDNPPSKAAGICLIALISIPDSVDVKEKSKKSIMKFTETNTST